MRRLKLDYAEATCLLSALEDSMGWDAEWGVQEDPHKRDMLHKLEEFCDVCRIDAETVMGQATDTQPSETPDV